jgi:hypothetical protein
MLGILTTQVPARLAADAVQVVRDMLNLETALANIGQFSLSTTGVVVTSPPS